MKHQKMADQAEPVTEAATLSASAPPRKRRVRPGGANYVVHIMGALGQTFCGRRTLSVNCIPIQEVGASPESECRSCQAALERAKARVGLRKLREAVARLDRDHPLPRCPHGRALRDHAGDVLTCPEGCVLTQESDRAP